MLAAGNEELVESRTVIKKMPIWSTGISKGKQHSADQEGEIPFVFVGENLGWRVEFAELGQRIAFEAQVSKQTASVVCRSAHFKYSTVFFWC